MITEYIRGYRVNAVQFIHDIKGSTVSDVVRLCWDELDTVKLNKGDPLTLEIELICKKLVVSERSYVVKNLDTLEITVVQEEEFKKHYKTEADFFNEEDA